MDVNGVLIRYLLVGLLNTLFGYSVFAALTWSGLHYSLALLLATILGIMFNFNTIGRLVFGNANRKIIWKFLITYGFLYLVNVFLVYLIKDYVRDVYTANAIVLVFVAALGFILNRSFVYANH